MIAPTHLHHLLLSDISTTPELRTLDVGRPQINVNVRKIPHWSDLIATTQRSTPTQKKSPKLEEMRKEMLKKRHPDVYVYAKNLKNETKNILLSDLIVATHRSTPTLTFSEFRC